MNNVNRTHKHVGYRMIECYSAAFWYTTWGGGSLKFSRLLFPYNKNSIQEEIKSRLKVGNACYYSVQNILFSSLLSKKLKIKMPVVLYGCETWSLTLREERRLRVFENRVLRRVFGPKRGEVTGEWRKLHNEELCDLYSLPNIVRVVKSRRIRWAGHVARMGEGRGVHRVLVGKPEGKRPLGRSRPRWEDNIKRDLQVVGGGCGEWMELAQDRDRWRALVSTATNLRVPKMRGIS